MIGQLLSNPTLRVSAECTRPGIIGVCANRIAGTGWLPPALRSAASEARPHSNVILDQAA